MSNNKFDTLRSTEDFVGPTATSLKQSSGKCAPWRGMLPRDLPWKEDDSDGFPTLSNTVSGPHRRHFVDDLIMSNEVYNNLADDEQLPEISLYHLHQLAQIFGRHNASGFGLHRLHRHFRIAEDTLMLGSAFGDGSVRRWTRPVLFQELPTSQFYGHIYALSPDHRFVAYEFLEGAAPQGTTLVDDAFFEELIEYLVSHKLTSVLGLEVLGHDSDPYQQIFEFVIAGQATAMVLGEDLKFKSVFQITGWCLAVDDGIFTFKGIVTHAEPPGGGKHQIFTDGKALPDIQSVVEVLRREGLV